MSRRFGRRFYVTGGCAAIGAASVHSAGAQTQIPPSVEFSVPKAYAMNFDVVGNCGVSVSNGKPAITCSHHAPVAVKGGVPLQNELIRVP
jgi:hypothetical protein